MCRLDPIFVLWLFVFHVRIAARAHAHLLLFLLWLPVCTWRTMADASVIWLQRLDTCLLDPLIFDLFYSRCMFIFNPWGHIIINNLGFKVELAFQFNRFKITFVLLIVPS